MDPHKRETILQMIQSLWGRQVNSLLDLTDGQFFIHALSLLEQFQTKVLDNSKDRLKCTERFLQENVDTELELSKIALVLYGIGVLDKNSRAFVDSALKLPVHMHADIMALIQSVVQAGTVDLLLIEAVLKAPSDVHIGLNPATKLSWLQTSPKSLLLPAFENQDLCLTLSPVKSENLNSPTPGQNAQMQSVATSTPKDARYFSFTPLADDKAVSEITSPLRDLSLHTSSPLLQFMQSPQVIQKATINQKDLEIRKLRQQLNDERYEKDELQDTLLEYQTQNVLKAQLHDRIKSLLAYQTAADELEELKIQYGDLECELNKLQEKLKEFENCKENVQFLEKLTDDQREELDKLSSEKKLLELEKMKNLTHSKNISQLESQIRYLQLQLDECTNCKTTLSNEKDSLVTNLQVAKDRNELLRQELDALQASRDDIALGESMGIVLDLQIQKCAESLSKNLESSESQKCELEEKNKNKIADLTANILTLKRRIRGI
ncbi:hypothetical protein Btru_077189 [Bulinus truncatus]|nr:hypothetical protein Btru_077189 [Bulinus truncatus]